MARAASRGVGWNTDDIGALMLASDPARITPDRVAEADYARVAKVMVELCPASIACTRADIDRGMREALRRLDAGWMDWGRVRRLVTRLNAIHITANRMWNAPDW